MCAGRRAATRQHHQMLLLSSQKSFPEKPAFLLQGMPVTTCRVLYLTAALASATYPVARQQIEGTEDVQRKARQLPLM
jgi:hypothetical protein